jgi:hypothetical protein
MHMGYLYGRKLSKHPKSRTLNMGVIVCMHMGYAYGHVCLHACMHVGYCLSSLVVSQVGLAYTCLSFGLLCGTNAVW